MQIGDNPLKTIMDSMRSHHNIDTVVAWILYMYDMNIVVAKMPAIDSSSGYLCLSG